jgi:hypothetical protein
MRQFNRVIKVAGKPGSRRFAHLMTFEERREREDMLFEANTRAYLMESLFREAAAHVALEDEPEGKPEVVN